MATGASPAEPWPKLLVLDLDETLIHARGPREAGLPWPHHRQWGPYRLWLRPGLEDFLAFAWSHFAAVGIWTASTADYAHPVLATFLDPARLAFIYCRERCTYRRDIDRDERYWVKDLRKVARFGFDRRAILAVDDTPRKFERSYGNLVAIRSFEGDPSDRELSRLTTYLRTLGPLDDVRPVEKRGWASRTP